MITIAEDFSVAKKKKKIIKFTKKVKVSKRALEVIFVVSQIIAKNIKTHTISFVDSNDIVNQFLCLKELKTNTRGKQIFETINFFVEMNGISWSDCVGICTEELQV